MGFRCQKEHKRRLEKLDECETKKLRKYWSKHYGINTRSVLLDLHDVNLATQIIHDPMHVFLEGVYNQHACIFLQVAMTNKVFTLDWLNKKLATYKYSYLDVANKPQQLTWDNVVNKLRLKQTAVGTLLIAYILPNILGEKINDSTDNKRVLDSYKNFLNLTNIVLLVASPIVDSNTSGELSLLIDFYINEFTRLHPQINLTPKTHYMRHIPQQIRYFGPGRGQWALRFESKHSQFKKHKLTNYRNVSKTLTYRAQRLQCFDMFTTGGTKCPNYFSQPPYYKSLLLANVNFAVDFSELLTELQVIFPDTTLDQSADIKELSELVLEGKKYKQGAYLLLRTDFEGPVFGQILNIMVKGVTFFSIVSEMKAELYWEFNAYRVTAKENKIVLFTKLVNRWPLSDFSFMGMSFITNRYSHCQNGVCI